MDKKESITGYFLDIQDKLLYQSRQVECSVTGTEPSIESNITDLAWGLPGYLNNYDFRDIDTGTPLYPVDIYTFKFKLGHWYRVVQGAKIQGYICYTTGETDPAKVQTEIAHISSEYYNKQINLLTIERQRQVQGIEEAKLIKAWHS